jgi:polysaccharide biosynthesis protein PslH
LGEAVGDIVFLAHRFPYPPDRGDKIRSWHILKALTKIAPVHVAALVDDPRDLGHVTFLKQHVASVTTASRAGSKLVAAAKAALTGESASVHAFANREFGAAVQAILTRHDISTIFAFSGQMAQFVPLERSGRNFIMDFVDMDSAKYDDFARGSIGMAAWANRLEAKRLLAFEKATAERADVSLFVSEAEANLFRSKTGLPGGKIHALGNGIDLAYFDPALPRLSVDAPEGPLIVFTGQMDYGPNVEAVVAFARETMPRILTREPNAHFAIVGRNPGPAVKALAALSRVVVTGEVADTRDWLAAAAVAVAPLKLARGVQNKVLEAMAMARPVVVSSGAAEGIDAALIVADTAQEEADEVISLLQDPLRAAAIGAANRAQMVARYGWDAQLARLADIVTAGR